jgi:hypothetical protein
MKRFVVLGLASIYIIACLPSCGTRHISQNEIVAFIKEFEKKAEYISRQKALYQWEYYTRGRSDSLEYYLAAERSIGNDPQQVSIIKKYLSLTKDEIYHRKLELIYRRCLRMVIDADPQILRVIDSLAGDIRKYRPTFEGQTYTVGQLLQMAVSESDSERRHQLYSASTAGGPGFAEGLAMLARMRNHAVSRLGYNSYYDLMLQADGVDKGDFSDLLEELDRLSSDSYRQALESLKNTRGVNYIRPYDIDYLFRQTDMQAAVYYPANAQASLVESTLGGLGFRLRAWPIYFAPMVASDQSAATKIVARHIPDDIRIPTDIANGRESLERLFSQTGLALYTANIDPQDFLLALPPAPCFEQGMAQVITGLTELSAWHRKYAGMPEPLVLELKMKNDFMRLHELRLALVNILFEQEIYADPFADLQEVYGGLFEKYMMYPLGADYYPWAIDINYISNSVSMQNDLIGGCIAAQTYHYLKEKYDRVLDDQHTREFLVQNIFRFGSRDDWQALLSRGTGERLQAKYYFEFPSD